MADCADIEMTDSQEESIGPVEVGDARDDSVEIVNVADYLPIMAMRQPDHPALIWTTALRPDGGAEYARMTFRELSEDVDRVALGLLAGGVRRGMRTILLVPPRRDFFVMTFALLKIGAVPVLIDPGMGARSVVRCLRAIEAEAFIGVPKAHVVRILSRAAFRSIRVRVTVGRRWFWGGMTLSGIRASNRVPAMPARSPMKPDDPAAIVFTSGSTGPAKGVLYRHGMFAAQVRMLRETFNIQRGEIDLPTFPLFALFAPALGMTAVLPDMDSTRPADVNPEHIIRAIRDHGVTQMFGSPALVDRVGRFGSERGVMLASLRRVISAGAPVRSDVLERFRALLSNDAEIYTPYGASEAMPLTVIGSRKILDATQHESAQGGGTCVGRPVEGATVRVIRLTDEPIANWSEDLVLPVGEIGEIVVRGEMVTREYVANTEANRLAKIADGENDWHRMGDAGRFDAQGRLWFCGRKAQRVVTPHGTMFTEPCEAIFNQHPRVRRSALVGVGSRGHQRPVICIEREPRDGDRNEEVLRRELMELARAHPLIREIEALLFHPGFPVDVRHNAKINREILAEWAARRVGS